MITEILEEVRNFSESCGVGFIHGQLVKFGEQNHDDRDCVAHPPGFLKGADTPYLFDLIENTLGPVTAMAVQPCLGESLTQSIDDRAFLNVNAAPRLTGPSARSMVHISCS
tara:strand:+ start:24984 stop:25316 length:333 start_codon:yes stop_codon:yes gene_type:complete